MDLVDFIIYGTSVVLFFAFIYIIVNYVKGLKGSPYELYLVFIAKIVEYTAYGSMNLAFVLFLSSDIGLSDMNAAYFITVWSLSLTIVNMMVGSIADTMGVKRTLMIGTGILVFARFVMPFTTNLYALTLLGFIPLGIGMAMKGPVLSVAIKKFTSHETAVLGFGLFYTLMNVGWAAGAWLFDFCRMNLGEHGSYDVIPGMGPMSTYQIIFAISLVCSVFNFILLYFMRDGVEYDDATSEVTITPSKPLKEGNIASAILHVMKEAFFDSIALMKKVFSEKSFWIFMGMLSILIFVRLVFYHFHYTFPKYGIRVLGEGLKIGSIFGVLNPVMIIFLTPLIAALTRKVKSYKVLLVGTFISSVSIFIATMPERVFEPMMHNWVGELIFVRWLDVPAAQQHPIFIALVIMVIFFTIGEAIWSPRLMQFTAEIAPKGKEGSYIALSYLPYFAAKFVAGPMSGWLLTRYIPEGAENYPDHIWVWAWIGGMSILSPIGLVIFKKAFNKKEIEQAEELKKRSDKDSDLEPQPA